MDFGCWASKSPKAVGGSDGQDMMPCARASTGVQAFPKASPEAQAMPRTLVGEGFVGDQSSAFIFFQGDFHFSTQSGDCSMQYFWD